MKVHAYTICDALYRPWLAGWIHWHKDRFDRLYLVCPDQDPACLALCERHGVEVIPTPEVSGYCINYYGAIWDHAARFGLQNWYAVIDVDEVFDLRFDPRTLAREVQATGNIYVWAQMIEQVPTDGALAPLPTDPASWFDLFPRQVRVHGGIRRANDWKPVLRRCDMRGLHAIEHKPGRRWHDPRQFKLHHFDWCTEGHVCALHKKRETWKLHWRLGLEYNRLLDAMDRGLTEDDMASLAPTF